MSALGNVTQTTQQLQQDLQNELNTANQLLRLISVELQQIKQLTESGGILEANINDNKTLVTALASLQQVDIDNIPPFTRKQVDMSMNENHHNEKENTFRNESEMEESQ